MYVPAKPMVEKDMFFSLLNTLPFMKNLRRVITLIEGTCRPCQNSMAQFEREYNTYFLTNSQDRSNKLEKII
jgi:hypothetical protein